MRITSLSLKSNKNSLTIKTKYNNFNAKKSEGIVGRQSSDFSNSYLTTYVTAELLNVGDYYFINNAEKYTPINSFNITSFIPFDKDLCFFPDEKDAKFFQKFDRYSKGVSKEEYKYFYDKYNLKNKSDIVKYLRTTKIIEVPTNLKINEGFLCLVSCYINKTFEIDPLHRQYVKLTNLTQKQIDLLLSYFTELTYNTNYRTNVVAVEDSLCIYSLLFINLFTNGFNHLNFITTLGKNKSKILLNFIDSNYSFIALDNLIESLNFQKFMFNSGYIVSVEQDEYLLSFIISNDLRDYYIKLENGFLLEITDIITIT